MQHLINFWKKSGFGDREIKAFKNVNRKNYLPDDLEEYAWEDVPLPIMRGKTISQPTTVMIMTAALELEPGMKVFEIGTGSGYQAAILARMVGKKGNVFTTEVIPELVQFASKNLAKEDIKNVHVMEMNGDKGLPEKAPFDRIILTAAAKAFPEELINQLKVDGIIIGPLGDEDVQEMIRGRKRSNGTLELMSLGAFRFTPLYGQYGFEI